VVGIFCMRHQPSHYSFHNSFQAMDTKEMLARLLWYVIEV
jgi:hypothetical protein